MQREAPLSPYVLELERVFRYDKNGGPELLKALINVQCDSVLLQDVICEGLFVGRAHQMPHGDRRPWCFLDLDPAIALHGNQSPSLHVAFWYIHTGDPKVMIW